MAALGEVREAGVLLAALDAAAEDDDVVVMAIDRDAAEDAAEDADVPIVLELEGEEEIDIVEDGAETVPEEAVEGLGEEGADELVDVQRSRKY